MMIGVVLATSGKLGSGMRDSVELIVGERSYFRVVELQERDTPRSFKQKMAEAILRADLGSGVIVLTDMAGGTPAQSTLLDLPHIEYRVVAGVNLPMLIEVMLRRDSLALPDLVDAAMRAGKKGITTWRVGEG